MENLNRRWSVLTFDHFSTYEKERAYGNATEVIEITKIKTVKSDEKKNTVFVLIVYIEIRNRRWDF